MDEVPEASAGSADNDTGSKPSMGQSILPLSPSVLCSKHHRTLEVYCETHETTICFVCAYKDHPSSSCNTVLLDEKVEKERKLFERQLPDTKVSLKTIQECCDNVTSKLSEAEDTFRTEEESIQDWLQTSKEHLKETYDSAVENLSTLYQENLRKAEKVADKIDKDLKTRWSTRKDAVDKILQAKCDLEEKVTVAEQVVADSMPKLEEISGARKALRAAVSNAKKLTSRRSKESTSIPLEIDLPTFDIDFKVDVIVAATEYKPYETASEGEEDKAVAETTGATADSNVTETTTTEGEGAAIEQSTHNQTSNGVHLMELLETAKSKYTGADKWDTLVVRRDKATSVQGHNIVIVNGPWCNSAFDYLTGKTEQNPGPINLAPPKENRSDYYCVLPIFARKLATFFGTMQNQTLTTFNKRDDFSEKIIIIGYLAGETRQEALTDELDLQWFDPNTTFVDVSSQMGDCAPNEVFIKNSSPLSPKKTIQHYLENTKAKLTDFTTLLFCMKH